MYPQIYDSEIEPINRSTVRPYEYDEYYNTRVNRPWAHAAYPIVLGLFLILLGIASIVFTAVDISRGSTISPFNFNPNNRIVGVSEFDNVNLAASWHENSIWPTLGKGIWIGLLMIVTGILAIVSKMDGSQIGVYAFNIASWVTVIFSLYLILSSILSIEAYPYNLLRNRNAVQNVELAMNALLIAMGTFALITSFIGAVMSCVYLDYCSNGRVYTKY